MSDVALGVRGLSKQYHIGEIGRARYETLRDKIAFLPRRLLGRPSAIKPRSTIWALDDVSFDLENGGALAVIGRNGAGKSTLLKILSRITEPTRGYADIYGRVGALLEVGTGFHPELTGRENIFLNGAILGMSKPQIASRLDEIIAFAEIEQFVDTPVKYYSSGMYLRLAFSVAAHMEPEILIVDEVLAVGDMAFQRKCMGKMGAVAREGRTVLFVSHNMGAVTRLCTTGLVLEHGRVSFHGHVSDAVAHYHQLVVTTSDAQAAGRAPHVLFEEEPQPEVEYSITKIEVLDENAAPMPTVSTWDTVRVRFHIYARTTLQRGSVILEIRTIEGTRVIVLSTQPDSTMPLPLEEGFQAVDCVIDELPLAAGQYVVAASIAVPNMDWLWFRPEIGILTVEARDVYKSGFAPHVRRAAVALHHRWEPAAVPSPLTRS